MKEITISEIANILGTTEGMVHESLKNQKVPILKYETVNQKERDLIILQNLRAIEQGNLRVSGTNDPEPWNIGWNEVLLRVKEKGVSLETLQPQYFRSDVLRYQGDYIKCNSKTFEHDFYTIIRRSIFHKYLSEYGKIIEFGCGTGTNLFILGKILSKPHLIGCDWAVPSQKILEEINQHVDYEIRGVNFNMLTLQADEEIRFDENTAVITMHALEQLGNKFHNFLDYIVDRRPGICLHLEPIVELYDKNVLIDYLAIQYHIKRNYLKGFLPALEEKESQNKIEIITTNRFGIGNSYHEAYTLIVWKPK